MTTTPENIILNSCAYTPVYLLQNPDITQPGSYIITQQKQEPQKPITDNLKRFYESSGNLENTAVYNDNSLLKQESVKVGNNLKLASFLVPKDNNISKQQYVLANSVALTSTNTTSSNALLVNTNITQRIDMDRKIVKLHHSLDVLRQCPEGRILPKMKPKDQKPMSKPTSVHLVKLGATYHSLDHLNEYQMGIVNQAMKGIKDTEKKPPKPTYDPITNTRFIYRVISPKDLTIVGKNKIVCKQRKNENKKENIKEIAAKNNVDCDTNDIISQPTEPKVTRSGRKIKVPNHMVPETLVMQRPRRHTVQCVKCPVEFPNIYGLNKHYEKHIQNSTHVNLFDCLLDIVKNNSNKDEAYVFIQELEQFVENMKLLLPCLLKNTDGIEGKLCSIKDNVGRLFGIKPGEYKFNMDALNCVKDKDGYCKHNQQKNKQFNSDISKPSQLWMSKHNEEIANTENEMGDCARINPVDKWPKVGKRIKKYRQKQNGNIKKIRLASENTNTIIELGSENLNEFNNNVNAINTTQMETLHVLVNNNEMTEANEKQIVNEKISNKVGKKTKFQFHSAHFDIRSSPIKSTTNTFQKFQITPDTIDTKYVKIIKHLTLDTETKGTRENIQNNVNKSLDLQAAFRDANVPCQGTNMSNNVINDSNNCKEWIISPPPSTEEIDENYTKLNHITESTLNSTNDEILLNQTKPTVNSDVIQTEHLVTCDNPIQSSSGQSLPNILDSFFNDLLTFNDFC